MKVFITGASGFIGSAVTRELIGLGYEVTGLARSKESAVKLSDSGATPLYGSLEDIAILK